MPALFLSAGPTRMLANALGRCLPLGMAFGGNAAPPPLPAASGRAAGFTLLIMALILFGAAVVAAVAVPRWQAAQRASRARETVAAMSQFADAFQQYAHDHGDWPAAVNAPAAYPDGMDAALGPAWHAPAPIGGHYVWLVQTLQRGERVRAAIGIVSAAGSHVSRDRRQLNALADEAKAGRIEAHRLRFGYREQPVYVLEH